MNIIIRTIDKILFTEVADEITLPGLYGKVGIRPHHSTMSVILCGGEVQVKLANGNKAFQVENGLAHVSNNTVDVLFAL